MGKVCDLARAAELVQDGDVVARVIVTAERLVERLEGTLPPDEGTVIPGFLVEAVVECPGGARPGSCYPLYDYDREALGAYLSSPDEMLEKQARQGGSGDLTAGGCSRGGAPCIGRQTS